MGYKLNSQHLYFQTLHYPAILKVLGNNLVDVFPVYIGIPDGLGVHDHHRAFCTAVQTPGSINAHPALAGKPQRLAALLGIIP